MMEIVNNQTDVETNLTCISRYHLTAILKCNDAISRSEFKFDSSHLYVNAALTATHNAWIFFLNYAWVLFLSVLLVSLVYLVYISYWSPVTYKKELTEVGFEHIPSGADRQRRITRSQSTRRIGNKIPPPYPNGWFAIAESRELKIGSVMPVDVLGQNLAVYRGEDGAARCVDAYCPHLGANIAVGGAVCGNCIECPFHQWRFNEDGACVAVPGVDAPKGVVIKKWVTTEADGAVWIWHDAEGRAPLWTLTDADQYQKWSYRGRNEFIVSAHVQEIPENGADVAHLNAVHSPSLVTSLADKYPFLSYIIGRHVWNATWIKNDDHTASISLTHDYKLWKYDFMHVQLEIAQIGPGHVRLHMNTPVGPFLFSQSVTPLGPLLQRVVHRLYSPAYNALFSSFLIYSESAMIERDIRIWNSKLFVSAPAYVKTDKTIRAFRNWFSQFYSEHSVTFRDSLQHPLDW